MKIIFALLSLFTFSIINAQSSTASNQVSSFLLEAPQLNTTKKILVYLPKNYATSNKKYPGIYITRSLGMSYASKLGIIPEP